MMLAIRQCLPGETGVLLSEYWELVDGKLGGVSALLYACYLRRPDVAEAIARRRRTIDVFEAAALGDTAKLAAMLDGDAALANSTAADGFQPLGLACFFGRADAAALLIERGADVAAASTNPSRVAPLHSAVAAGAAPIVAVLLDKGAPVDVPQQGGFTPLMSAAHRGDAMIVEMLLRHGATPELKDDTGSTAADHAATAGHAELAASLAPRPAGDADEDDQPAASLDQAEPLAQ